MAKVLTIPGAKPSSDFPLPKSPRFIPGAGALQSSCVTGEMRLMLPLPPAALSPNSRTCWQAKARAVKKYREEAKIVAWMNVREAAAFGFPWQAATIEAVFYFGKKRQRDRDNLLASMKSAIDGLADGGVVSNDSAFTFLPVVLLIDKSSPRAELIIRRIDPC